MDAPETGFGTYQRICTVWVQAHVSANVCTQGPAGQYGSHVRDDAIWPLLDNIPDAKALQGNMEAM